jgi:Flp pilus assembly protein TadD
MSSFSRKKFAGPFAKGAASKDVFSTDYDLSGWPIVLFQAALIAIVGLWVYSPAFFGTPLWDDDIYIFKNPLMTDADRLWKAWFVPGSFMEYYPIQQTVQWWQWLLWQNDTFGYHLTNVLLHIASALLIWRLFAKLSVPLAWIGGLIFISHPVNVESVAWMVELKNTLSLPPFLLAMCFWIDYENSKSGRDYALALGFFVVAMFCKISMAPFPLVILLYAWWKRRRVGLGDVVASVPFLIVSVVLIETAKYAAATYGQAISGGIDDTLPIDGISTRFALIGLAGAFYVSHILLPITLLPVYPMWDVNPPSALQFLPWLVFAGVLTVLWWRRKAWGRHVALGLGFSLIMLAPVLAFGFAFHPRDSWVMDHFLYIPVIGIIGLVTAALGQIEATLSRQHRVYILAAITLIVVLLAFVAHGYAATFTDAETFWSYTLDRNPGAWSAHVGLGGIRQREGNFDEAKAQFEAALQLKPDDSKALAELGITYIQMGRVQDGIAQFRRALEVNPNDAITLNDLGATLAQLGQFPEAQKRFEQATKVQPNYAQAHGNLGNIYLKLGKLDAAERSYRQALKVKPNYPEAHYNLGILLNQTGHTEDAIAQFDEAIRLNPGYLAAHLSLGAALEQAGRKSDAAEQFSEALQLDPTNHTAQAALARLRGAPASLLK